MAAVVVAPVCTRIISSQRFFASSSSSVCAVQHLFVFLFFSTRRRPSPSLSVVSNPTRFFSPLYPVISFPKISVPIPFSNVSQNLFVFLSFSTKKNPPPLLSVVSNPTCIFSSLYYLKSFPKFSVPIPFSNVSHHTLAVRGGISRSPSTVRFPIIRRGYSCIASNSTGLDWTPPLRVNNAFDALTVENGSDDNENHWIVVMGTYGLEFETEQALFNYYIKTLAAIVGSDEEAKQRIYLVSCGLCFGFGAELDKKTSEKLYEQPGVGFVIEDDTHDFMKPRFAAIQPTPRFTPINWNHRIDDILSYHHLSEVNSAWISDHWLIHIQPPCGEFTTKQQVTDYCIRILAKVVGSEDDAIKKIYGIWCKIPIGFAAEIDEETVNRLKVLPDVLLVLPDYAFDIKFLCGSEGEGVLVVLPPPHLKSGSAYYNDQPSRVLFDEDSKETMEGSLSEIVQSLACSTVKNHNNRLYNIFSYHHLSERNSKWNSDHWLIIIKQPECGFTTDLQTLDFFIKILAEAVGSEQEAKEKIYIIWSNFPLGFGAQIDGETSNKLKVCPNVLKVLPDYAFDVKNNVSSALLISHHLPEMKYYFYANFCGSSSLKDLNRAHLLCPEYLDY